MAPVADLVIKVAGPAFRRHGFTQTDIILQWHAIAGDLLARHTAPERISFSAASASGGTLYIRADGAFALEVLHLEPLIVDRINAYYGYPAIARLAIRQGPMPDIKRRRVWQPRPLTPLQQAELCETVGQTADDGLRQALESLGAAVIGESEGAASGKGAPKATPKSRPRSDRNQR